MVYNNTEMWDMIRLSTRGNFSLRKLALLFVAALTSALFMALAHTSTSYADGATWSGDNISYGGKTYTKMTDAPILPGISSDNNQIYQSTDGNTVSIIAFKETDKTKDISDAQIASFTKDEGNNYTSAGPPTSLAIAASTDGGDASGDKQGKTSCAVEGIGWMICYPSRFIANGMDKVYGWVSGFLTIKPLTTDTDSGLYQAWLIARNIADACFILAFLVIIYSQITNYGISNYEIKKMIPKLIIAAILVNLSYFICAIAVDISNILGDSVQKALIDIRNTVVSHKASGNFDGNTWQNWTEYILSGGTLTVAGLAGVGALATATGGSVVSLIFLLLPALAVGILSVIVALAILAARQALIIVLVVISPLAFVAFLLPNTEKWFNKWRELLTTMLLMFPLFSLLFGGSQLASALVIQNADQASVVILALFIQVAPLAITPFLIQISGSLLGRFAGMVNNPSKGLVDRTRGWSKERADQHAARAKVLGEANNRFGPRRFAFKREMGNRNRQDQLKMYQNKLDAAWADDSRSHQLGVQSKGADLRKAMAHAETEVAYEKELARTGNTAWQHMRGRQRIGEESVKMMQSRENASWEEAKSNKMPINNQFANFSIDSKAVLRSQKIADGQTMFAQSEQSDEWAKLVLSNESLQAQVGGIGGKERALARATSEFRKNYGERIGEGKAVVDHFNLSGSDRQAHALGQTITVRDSMGNIKTFTPDSNYTRESVIDTQIRQGTAEEVEGIIKVSGTDLLHYTTTISQAVAEAGISKKLIYAGGQTIDNIGQGNIVGDASLDDMARATILKGKIGAADLATNEALGLQRLYNVAAAPIPATMSPADAAAYRAEVQAMQQAAYVALTNPSLRGSIKANARVELNKIIKHNLGTTTIHDADGNPVSIDIHRTY